MTTTVQARVDDDIRKEASLVLERWGLTVSDAVRILLTRTALEGRLPMELLSTTPEHDAWFKAQVNQALHDEIEVEDDKVSAEFAKRRAKVRSS